MSGYCQHGKGREQHDQRSGDKTKGSSTNDSRIGKFWQQSRSRQQHRPDLNDSDPQRATKQQILQLPHRQRILQCCKVLRSPNARDCAMIHDCPSRHALFRDEKGCVLRGREGGGVNRRKMVDRACHWKGRLEQLCVISQAILVASVNWISYQLSNAGN